MIVRSSHKRRALEKGMKKGEDISALSMHSSFLNGDGKDYRAFQRMRMPTCACTRAHVSSRASRARTRQEFILAESRPETPQHRHLTKERLAKGVVEIKIFTAKVAAATRIRER